MKTYNRLLLAGLFLGVVASVSVAASSTVLDVGARYHQKHSEFAELPYDDGDLTYALGYEIHEENMMLQLVCGFTPENDYMDYGITPEANLLLKDRLLHGGVGILSTYQSVEEGDSEWMDMYYQFILGLNLPLGNRLNLQANAYYVFDAWSNLGDFDAGDIEFGGFLGMKF